MTDGLEIYVTPCEGMEDLRVYEIEITCAWWSLQQRVHHDHLVDAVRDAVEAYARNVTPTTKRETP